MARLFGLVLFAVAMLPGAAAGAPLYDMQPFLNEPHPFTVQPPARAPVPTDPRRWGRLYDMSRFLNEPHPFANAPVPPPPYPRAAAPVDRTGRDAL